ncbi:MAG: hypothetical protein HYY52_04740 [Candidatus Melainabacteria bacterium]|nr:hypothetical protein [Candidatus Melainabacteria bacterium]
MGLRIDDQTLSLAEIRSRKDIPPVNLCISPEVEKEDAEWLARREAGLLPDVEYTEQQSRATCEWMELRLKARTRDY